MRTTVAAVLVVVALTGCGGGTSEDSQPSAASASASASASKAPPQLTQLEEVFEACSKKDPDETLSQPDSMTLIVDTGSEYGDLAGYSCALDELETPPGLLAKMENTNALMGQQTDEDRDRGLEYTWSYHPDNGVNMIVEDITDI